MSTEAERSSTRQQVNSQLSQIIGLRLTEARRAADMRMLEFDTSNPINTESLGTFSLHIQCPWRIEGPYGIVTGRLDLYQAVKGSPDTDFDPYDYEKLPNQQDSQINQWLARHGTELVVQSIEADEYGGAAVHFQASFILRMFPAGTCGEDWRLFGPERDSPHFVICGGAVEAPDEPN